MSYRPGMLYCRVAYLLALFHSVTYVYMVTIVLNQNI